MRNLLLVLLLVASIVPARASDILTRCTQTEDWWARIAACTEAIDSGRWPGASASWAYSNRAVAYAALGDYIAAFDDHEKAVKLDPSNAVARNNKANSHADFREYTRALAEYSAAIRLRPGYLNAHFNRAGVHFALGQHAEAVADYDVVIAEMPDFGAAFAGRAEALCRMGAYDRSVADRMAAIDHGALTDVAVADYLREKGYLGLASEAAPADGLRPALENWTKAGCP